MIKQISFLQFNLAEVKVKWLNGIAIEFYLYQFSLD